MFININLKINQIYIKEKLDYYKKNCITESDILIFIDYYIYFIHDYSFSWVAIIFFAFFLFFLGGSYPG